MPKLRIALVIWLALFLPLLLCGLSNIFARTYFLPSAQFLGAMTVPANVIAVILVVPFVALTPLLFRSSTSWRRWVFLVVPVVMFFVLRDNILHDVPWVANRIAASSHGELTVKVEKKPDGYRAKRCYGSVLVSYEGVSEGRLCRLDERLWNSIAANDRLVLSGSSSYFGIDYSKVELLLRSSPTIASGR